MFPHHLAELLPIVHREHCLTWWEGAGAELMGVRGRDVIIVESKIDSVDPQPCDEGDDLHHICFHCDRAGKVAALHCIISIPRKPISEDVFCEILQLLVTLNCYIISIELIDNVAHVVLDDVPDLDTIITIVVAREL